MSGARGRSLSATAVIRVFAAGLGILLPGLIAGDQPVKSKDQSPARADGQKVVSGEKEKETSRSSRFLQPPGSQGRYDEDATDWRDVPPWRQTSFFGVRAQAKFVVYVVDCSGSMIEEDRLARAKEEVRKSVLALREPQRFKVIFYNDQPIAMPGELPRPADLASKAQLLSWLRMIEPDGATDPRPAMGLALALQPDAVFLLSDGEFPEGTVEGVARKNPRKVPIHCVDLSGGEAGDQLERIAKESGGRYARRPWTGQ